jgi:hypothetical protein
MMMTLSITPHDTFATKHRNIKSARFDSDINSPQCHQPRVRIAGPDSAYVTGASLRIDGGFAA